MTTFRAILLAGCAVGAAIMGCAPAEAQVSTDEAAPQTPGSSEIGEIIVTAQKRSERISDVPMSITAASGEQLADRGITNVADLQKIVPGLTFQPSDYGSPIYTIRGIGLKDIAVAVAPTVSVYVDQVPLPYSAETLGASLDLERVEVLKGPQGTLFGQNSTGGAINYIAAKPTDELHAGAELTYGRFDQVDGQVFVSGPIASGVKVRVAARTEQRGDWQESQTRNDGLGSRDFNLGRILLDVEPSDKLKLQFNVNGWIDKSDTRAAQFMRFAPALTAAQGANTILFPGLMAYQPAPDNARIADWDPNVSYRSDDNFFQASLRSDYSLTDDVTLTSITAYSKFNQNAPIDPDGTALEDFNLILNTHIKSFSQELRLAGNLSDGRVRWMIGGNYSHDKTSDFQNGLTQGSSIGVFGITRSIFYNTSEQRIKTSAVYGSLDFDLTSQLTLQGSVRYTDSRNSFGGCVRAEGDFAAVFAAAFGVTIPANGCVTLDDINGTFQPGMVKLKLNEDNLSWRASLNYKLNANDLIYVNVTKGYKAGAFPTVPAVFASFDRPVKQESVLAYEAGFKVALLGRMAQITGASFYYDYKDKQQIGYVDSLLFGANPGEISIPSSRVYGAELGIMLRPTSGLTLNGGATYVNSKVLSNKSSFDPFKTPVSLKGESFPNTPKWQYNIDADYRYPLSDSVTLSLGANFSFRSGTVAAFGSSTEFAIPSYGLIDLRAGVDVDRFRIQVWGHNVTNKFYLTTVTHTIDTVNRVVGMPATYGVTVGYKF